MWEFIKPKMLVYEQEISKSSKPQIKPLLSKEVEQQGNLKFNIMQNAISKPDVSPVQIKTDFVSDEKVTAELGPDYDPLCSQLTYKADI